MRQQHTGDAFDVVETGIRQLRIALEEGITTSEELLEAYLARIRAYDQSGPLLNSVVELNPRARAECRASDQRRRAGSLLGPLDGIIYTAKDSYLVQGMTAAAGSPAFSQLRAQKDAFAIERLKDAGAICLGLTNMPPMANGGMQRGVYGRAESPYSAEYLTSAFGSGSSNGSGTATAASFAAFGLGEETWSSGRAPASNNGLAAYTPSRGIISVRGNWPLVPTMDVVVPHTRTMDDLLEVLDVLVVDDDQTDGDLWREQEAVPLPKPSQIRPHSFTSLRITDRAEALRRLNGVCLGAPRMYLNADPEAGTGKTVGIGGSTGQRIHTRPSILLLWEQLVTQLKQAEVSVQLCDFPVVSRYEGDRPGVGNIRTRGLVPEDFLRAEVNELSALSWGRFLRYNADPELSSLTQVQGDRIFPPPPGALPDRYDGFDDDISLFPAMLRENPSLSLTDIPHLEEGLTGLEQTRQTDLEEWMDHLGLDALLFPSAADVGPATMDVDPEAADQGWRNGVWVANGNLAIRHLGIPTVTIPLGVMSDTHMPVGVTIAGRAYDDAQLLQLACAVEQLAPGRIPAPRTPPLSAAATTRIRGAS